jgi:hypothetical protein
MINYTRFSVRASLGAVGMLMRRMKIWEAIEQHVGIQQKIIKYTPLEKLMDAFINILAGGHGLVEINTRVRKDEMLLWAFGRRECAEQSTVSDTLNACTPENVMEMRQALQEIYRAHSEGYRHDYESQWQVLDVDLTGMPAGRQGEGVTKGYFSGRKHRRGRQLGRVLATLYDEIVVERLYCGKTQLERSLQALVRAAEEVLDLDERSRQRTIVRVDGGGGRDADINWLLQRGYFLIVKVKNWQRSVKLARSVRTWHPDPKTPSREVGWVEEPHPYERPTRQVAVRKRNNKGEWHYRVLVFALSNEQLFYLARQPLRQNPAPVQILLAALHAYDLRGGGVETSVKGSKQGLGLTKRNKRSFAAQEMLVLLAQLAYNLITWTRTLLAGPNPRLQGFGPLRIIRDIFQIEGKLRLDAQGRIIEITLNEAHPFALPFVRAVSSLLDRDGLSLILGQI